MQATAVVPEDEILRNRSIAKRMAPENRARGLTYHIEAYGCQMNARDSETIAGTLEEMGYARAADMAHADMIVFNTCCVREHAEERVFGNIGALKKRKDEEPELKIVVCGCMPQQQETAARMYKRFPFVDMIVGTNELHRFPALLERAALGERVLQVRRIDGEIAEGLPVHRLGSFSTCVNITYGCNNFCTYCIVPYVRGRERSRTSESILGEVREAAQQGFKEIMLLGQNVNSYRGDGGAVDFAALLPMVNGVEGVERIRFMSSHPKDLSARLIEAMATTPKVCRHIHLPVQSGSDKILAAMNRRYTHAQYLSLAADLRKAMPDIEITTDIIVGFPGESEADFADTLSLMREVGFAAAFTFKYSPRKGTQAAAMEEQVEEAVKKERLQRLNDLQTEISRLRNEEYVGKRGTVLIEGCDTRETPLLFGKLSNSRMVYFPGDEALVGSLAQVRITHTQNNSLIGVLEEERNEL